VPKKRKHPWEPARQGRSRWERFQKAVEEGLHPEDPCVLKKRWGKSGQRPKRSLTSATRDADGALKRWTAEKKERLEKREYDRTRYLKQKAIKKAAAAKAAAAKKKAPAPAKKKATASAAKQAAPPRK